MPLPVALAGLLPLLKAGGIAAAGAGGAAAANKIANKIHNKISSGGSKKSNIKQGGVTGGGTLGEKLFGTQNRVEQFANRTPEQMAAQNAALQQALKSLQSNQFDFAPIEQQARQGFERQTIPSISERFANSGGSSAYGDQIAQAGKDLETQLAVLRSQHALGQQGLNQNLLKLGLSPQFENAFFPAQSGLVQNTLANIDQGSVIRLIQELLNRGKGSQQSTQLSGQQENQLDGTFSQNPDLAEFANQGVAPSNPLTTYLNQASGQANLNNNGLQNLLSQQGAQAGLGTSNPLTGKFTSLNGLKALYPQARF